VLPLLQQCLIEVLSVQASCPCENGPEHGVLTDFLLISGCQILDHHCFSSKNIAKETSIGQRSQSATKLNSEPLRVAVLLRYINGDRARHTDEVIQRSPLSVLQEIEEEHGLATVLCWEDTENQEPKKCHRHLLVAMMQPEPEVLPTWHEIFAQDVIESETVKNGIPVQVVRKRRG
jgi:hypothetical protein